MNVVITGTIEGISTRVDKTMKVAIGTNELSSEDKVRLMDFHQKFAKIYITDREVITTEDKEAIDSVSLLAPTKKKKSPSEMLRGKLYKLFKASEGYIGDDYYIEFDAFYKAAMSSLCDYVDKLVDKKTIEE